MAAGQGNTDFISLSLMPMLQEKKKKKEGTENVT
jgi:hypothetical protein